MGVGTTSPSEKLDINGNLRVRGSENNNAQVTDMFFQSPPVRGQNGIGH